MHHVAIMRKSWGLIPKIRSGEKTIESRWYQSRRAPWGRISAGDTVFFKDAGGSVSARARVSRVLELELPSLAAVRKVIRRYGKDICLPERNPEQWGKRPRYCILVFLADPAAVKPFFIRKAGYGAASAWLCTPHIGKLRA